MKRTLQEMVALREEILSGRCPPDDDPLGYVLEDEEELMAEVERLRALCLEAAGYIGLRSGPEVDAEADTMRDRLVKAAEGKEA